MTESNLPAHSHTCSDNGSHSHTTNSQSTSTTGTESAHEKFSGSSNHSHEVKYSGSEGLIVNKMTYYVNGRYAGATGTRVTETYCVNDNNATGYVVTDVKTVSISGTCTGDHTHSFSHTHGTDSQGSHSHTISSDSTKLKGTSFSILPPYIVKYCFERTA